ncbi:MAG: hypothetical protein PHI18_04745 [bacterium]|nr:hypothetical protein [bacterium]
MTWRFWRKALATAKSDDDLLRETDQLVEKWLARDKNVAMMILTAKGSALAGSSYELGQICQCFVQAEHARISAILENNS